MELDLLAVFAAVASARSFSGAARRLGMPNSSVSRRVARLEAALGVRLLHRTTRSVSLSTAGTALYDRIAPLLAALSEATSELPERTEQPSGDLRVTAPADLGAPLLAEIAGRYLARYPGVRVDLHLTNRVVDVVAEGFDVALRMARALRPSASLVARRAVTVPSHLYAAPAYLARRGTPRTPRDLAEHDFVIFRGFPRQLELTGPGERAMLEPRGRMSCDDLLFARDAARAGAGLALLPAFHAEPDVLSGALVRVLPRWQQAGATLFVVYPLSRSVPRKTTAFRDLVLEVLKARPLTPGG